MAAFLSAIEFYKFGEVIGFRTRYSEFFIHRQHSPVNYLCLRRNAAIPIGRETSGTAGTRGAARGAGVRGPDAAAPGGVRGLGRARSPPGGHRRRRASRYRPRFRSTLAYGRGGRGSLQNPCARPTTPYRPAGPLCVSTLQGAPDTTCAARRAVTRTTRRSFRLVNKPLQTQCQQLP